MTGKIPELFKTLMTPHIENVDEAISPGLTVLHWTSLKLDGFIKCVHRAVASLEHLLDTVLSIHQHRVKQTFLDMLHTPLCSVPDNDVISVEQFLRTTEALCSTASITLEAKSHIVEKAVQELVCLLLKTDDKLPPEVPEDISSPGALSVSRLRDQRVRLHQEANLLVEHYEQQNVETLIHLLRSTMEAIRKRLSTSTLSYKEYAPSSTDSRKETTPLFIADAVLSLPSLIMKPSLDEVQQAVNHVVQMIIAISKHVYCWGQQRSAASQHQATASTQAMHLGSPSFLRLRSKSDLQSSSVKLRNYFHVVGEHKDVLKIAAVLSSIVNATKTVVVPCLGHFNKYNHLWLTDREQHVAKFSEGNPVVDDYRIEMNQYAQLEGEILQELSVMPAGTILLRTEQLKSTLITEAKQWRVSYGRSMSHYYQAMMDETFKSIEEWNKMLSRPLKDLDDIRSIMATLKEIRENEIRIDMCLGPVEVST